jgi:ABC-2 type transport system permease protein
MFKKELLEWVRTYRLPIVLALFLLIGLGSPLLAKIIPDLLSSFTAEDQAMELILLKTPDTTDALFQYQKNLALLPLVIVLVSMGMVSGERRRGTAHLVLAKPVSRRAFLLAKIAMPALLYLAGTLIAAGGCLLYTNILFGEVYLPGFLVLNLLFVLMFWCYLAVTAFGSVVFSSTPAAAGLGLGCWAFFSILAFLPGIGTYTPAGLQSGITDLVMGRENSALAATGIVSALFILLLVAVADRVFSRQEL